MISRISKRKPNGYKINYILTPEYNLWRKKYNKLLDTAISSWSGFVYQGKIAIYYVLTQIENGNYTLQLDSIDDFAILDDNGRIIYIHQVKAKKSQNFSSYNKAFGQLQDGGDVIRCTNLFFHLAQSISDKTINSIETDFAPVKVYLYDTVPYCEVNQIDSKIESLIGELMVTYHPHDTSKTEPDYITKVRRYLDDLVVKKLLEIHRIIHLNLQTETEAAYQQRIPFSDFINCLRLDLNQEELGENYFYYLLITDMGRYYQDFCQENENELDENDLQRLNFSMMQFQNLDQKNIVNFIKNIMPHRTFKFETIKDYKDNTPLKDEIQGAFLKIIQDIKSKPIFNEDTYLLQWTGNNKLFSPTSIDKGPSHKEKICSDIVKNALSTDLNVLFEGNKLITTDIDVPEIVSQSIIENFNEEEAERKKDHIMKWKSVSLIPLETAKGIIDA